MNIIEWAQFLIGTGFLLTGLCVFVVELIGIFKFKYEQLFIHVGLHYNLHRLCKIVLIRYAMIY